MYEFIKGRIAGLSPAHAVIEAGAIGYYVNISLNTYSVLNGDKEALLLLHQVVREDAHLLYGFSNEEERGLFRLLISVSGIGSNTALVMLSAHTSSEIRSAILKDDVNFLKSIKGIGPKTAQRVIIELRDKLGKLGFESAENILPSVDSALKDDALSALVALGFPKKNIEKALEKVLKKESEITVEQLIKQSLKLL